MLDEETKLRLLQYFIWFWGTGVLLVIAYQIYNFIMRLVHKVWPNVITPQLILSVIAGALMSWVTIVLLIIYARKQSK